MLVKDEKLTHALLRLAVHGVAGAAGEGADALVGSRGVQAAL
jgi:hypothetical protein